MTNKASLLYALHDDVLERLVIGTDVASQGIAQAARLCKKRGIIGSTTCNKLINLDYAYNLVRHLTSVHVKSFLKNLDDEMRLASAHHTHAACGTMGTELCLDDLIPAVGEHSSDAEDKPCEQVKGKGACEATTSDDLKQLTDKLAAVETALSAMEAAAAAMPVVPPAFSQVRAPLLPVAEVDDDDAPSLSDLDDSDYAVLRAAGVSSRSAMEAAAMPVAPPVVTQAVYDDAVGYDDEFGYFDYGYSSDDNG